MKTPITSRLRKSGVRLFYLALVVISSMVAGSFSASAFTSTDVTTCYNAWWNKYSGAADFGWWTGAEIIEMVVDYGNTSHITTMCNKFTTAHGTDWSYNTFNDDVSWACIAFVRAYTATGNTTYRTIAKNNFDMMYARAWSSALGGGLWWNTGNTYKAAAVNFPAAIAAHLLSVALNDSSYTTKSQNIYNWGKANLFNATTGEVYDGMNADGSKSTATYSYNQGTFAGAAYYRGDSAAGTKSGDYVRNTWGNAMPGYGPGGDGAGFNGICLRWLAIMGYNPSWRQAVANQAWSTRNASNIAHCMWDQPTPSNFNDAWGSCNVVVAMKTVAPAAAQIAGTHRIFDKQSSKAIDNGSTTLGSGCVQWGISYTGGGGQQKWIFTQNADTSWNIINQSTGLALEMQATSNGAQVKVWTANGGSNQRWWVDVQSDGTYKIWNQWTGKALENASSTADGAPIIQWDWNGGSWQRWILL